LSLPAGLTSIGSKAFHCCQGMNGSIRSYNPTPPSAGSVIFNGISPLSILVPNASVSSYKATSGWDTYASDISALP
jgi:hypothetical protein